MAVPVITLEAQNLDRLNDNFKRAPQYTLKQLHRALDASIFSIQKHAVDKNFQFKTPRSRRTGYLRLSFGFGIRKDYRNLSATIGPTAKYAPDVLEGRRGVPNPYLDRIAAAAEGDINGHFEQVGDNVVNYLAKK